MQLSAIVLGLLASLSLGRAADWPQFLGPTRNAIAAGADLADSWPKDGPPVAWQHKLGSGWAGPVIAGAMIPQVPESKRLRGLYILTMLRA